MSESTSIGFGQRLRSDFCGASPLTGFSVPLLSIPQLLREICRFKLRPNFNVRVHEHWIRAAFEPFDGFVHRLNLPKPVASDLLLRRGERAINYCTLRA